MPRPRTAMRKIRDVLRLTFAERLSRRQVSAAVGVPFTTVCEYVQRAGQAGLSWPLPEGLDDEALEARLFVKAAPPVQLRPQPDWQYVHQELRRPGLTLMLLWLEYKERFPDGYQYSQFCRHYREWQRHLDVVMRQEHRAGEKLFVDFAGQRIPVYDRESGMLRFEAELFVAVLGASNYMYAEAFASQELPHWIAGHVHTFEFLAGCPQIVVCDNLRAGVRRAHRYEPGLNATYQEMAAHYGVAIIPARPRKPRDKAKVEAGVLIAERWIMARLRHRTFFELGELNVAVRDLLARVNRRPFKKLSGSRQSLFEEVDRPALKALPQDRYEFGLWKQAKVSIDYHVEVDRHYYSVPYQLVGQVCDVRLSATTVEIFRRGRRIASHVRNSQRGRHSTDPVHMPDAHRRHQEWTPGRILRWAEKTGPATAQMTQGILASRPHPEQGFRSCLGILRLGERFGDERVEAACQRALAVRAFSYRSVESILKSGLDRQPLPAQRPARVHRRHDNLRGAGYYR
ncbi:MAG: IS21 family transposase [Chloroflexota bacterium]|nr:MAG: IS21 family transposase [Chloroflexota bacterium]